MKFIVTILVFASSFNCFAGGTTGAGPDKLNRIENINIGSQVFFINKKQSELQFATGIEGSREVDIHSLRIEEISDSALLEGLKRSKQSQKWEVIKAPSVIDINKAMNLNGLSDFLRN